MTDMLKKVKFAEEASYEFRKSVKMIKVIAIDEKSSYLSMVMNLGDENRHRLGFLPKGAFTSGPATRKYSLPRMRLENFWAICYIRQAERRHP